MNELDCRIAVFPRRITGQNLHAEERLESQRLAREWDEAHSGCHQAAEPGKAMALYNLGISYRNGEGVPEGDVLEHMRCNLAASRSTGELREDAVNNRGVIAGQMTLDDLSEAQRFALD